MSARICLIFSNVLQLYFRAVALQLLVGERLLVHEPFHPIKVLVLAFGHVLIFKQLVLVRHLVLSEILIQNTAVDVRDLVPALRLVLVHITA